MKKIAQTVGSVQIVLMKIKALIKKYEKSQDKVEELRWEDECLDNDVCIELRAAIKKRAKLQAKIKSKMKSYILRS